MGGDDCIAGTSSYRRRYHRQKETLLCDIHGCVFGCFGSFGLRALWMRQNMITAIDLFNTQSKMNIQLGIGVDEGTVAIGERSINYVIVAHSNSNS